MFTEDKIIEMFCLSDDFCNSFDKLFSATFNIIALVTWLCAWAIP